MDDVSQSRKREALDLPTLALTAAASGAAALLCSQIWAPGTLASAAVTPVLVALLMEALRKPTEAVTRVSPRRTGEPPASDAEPSGEAEAQAAEQTAVRAPALTDRQRHWRLAAVTGVLGFVACALVFTLPELVAGSSATGDDRKTTLFGGGSGSQPRTTVVPVQTVTTVLPPQTVTAPPPETQPPPATVTVPPPTTTEPSRTTPRTTTTPPTTTPRTTTAPPATQPPP